MRIHSLEKIEQLKKLRKKGLSINELVVKFSIPKTTVWHHVHSVKIPLGYAIILKAKQGGSTKRREKKIKKAQEYSKQLLKTDYREIIIAASMLYWGEGSKNVCELINSDGQIIKCYLIFLRKVLNISEKFIKPTLRIFSGMEEKKCLNYWSDITGIPKHRFLIRLNDGGTKGRTKFGMCRITVRKGSDTLKLLHAIIEQVSEMIIKTNI